MTHKCAYMHAYDPGDWSKCPQDSGPVREYRFKDGSTQWYCDDGARQVRDERPDLELADQTTGNDL